MSFFGFLHVFAEFAVVFLCKRKRLYTKMWKRKKIVGLHRKNEKKRNGLPLCFVRKTVWMPVISFFAFLCSGDKDPCAAPA